jgi:putative ABC transport system permease protein
MLAESYESRIEQIPGVSDATHQSWFGGIYQEPKNFFAQIVVEQDEFLGFYPEYQLNAEHLAAFQATRTGAIAGQGLADRFGWKVGDRIPINGTTWIQKDGSETWEFDLVGIYQGAEKGTDTSQFFFRYDYFNESRSFGEGMVGWYVAKIEDPDRAAEIAVAIDDEFANSQMETKSEPEGAFIQGFANQIGNIGLIMTAIVSAVFFTILLVAGNTMAYAVRERTNELAVLKAIGFTDRGVLGLVLGESLFLSVIGGTIGLALAWLLISMGDPTNGSFPTFYFPLKDLYRGIGLIFLMAIVSGLIPALQAQRLQIADALRR